ncbi:helicase-like transcription factor isoform X2 [Ambystoma mexicanum]|uniref:helicase-like transcription factor isoform X2 n=1 Tax=Ambystoma mexicanum TaxID=8296 RepID=UPI0037E8FF2F
MSWMFMRGPIWKYLQSAQYGRSGNLSHFGSPNIFFNPEPEELISLDDTISASADEDVDSAVLYGTLRGNVVGLRYYTGVVNNNEMVALQREPTNPYDRNAVKVNNVNGDQVGHIKKELAAALAYIMDNKLAKVEGVVPYGANNAFTMPVQLSFWGKEENKEAVLAHLKRHGFKLGPDSKDILASLQADIGEWAERGNLPWQRRGGRRANKRTKGSQFSFESSWVSERAGPSYGAPSLPAVQMTTEQLKTEFDKLFEDLREDDKTREMEPVEAVGTTLLSHQKQALAWMVSRENSKDLPPFWEQRNNLYYNTLTNFAEKEKPENVLGGILADDMGLGKTLATIALILTNFHDGKPFPVSRIETHLLTKNFSDPGNSQKCKDTVKAEEDDGSKLLYALPKATAQNIKVERDGNEITNMVQAETSDGRPKRLKSKKAKYTFSSDSEVEEVIPLKSKGVVSHLEEDKDFADALHGPPIRARKKCKNKGVVSHLEEDNDFADALNGQPITARKKCKNKGLSVQHCTSKTASEAEPRTTLIVCPLSVLSNWMEQFENHVTPDVQLNITVYYGADRNKDSAVLAQQDVVLTTYSVLSFDYGNRSESPLHKIKWLRVVLDEGHTIRNPNAQQTKAALELDAQRRWVLTGTPIQNSLKDLWSLLSFFKLKPFTDREWWHRTIQRPVTMGDSAGLRYFNEGTVLTHYADVLALLVRLRQLCCHPHLVSNTSLSTGPPGDSTPEELRERLVNKMKVVLSSGSDEECAICLDSLNFPVITHCAHVFCKPCICQVIHSEQPNAKCPLCRNNLCLENLVECPPEEMDPITGGKTERDWMSSSKVDALMHALINLRKKDPAIKSIIVSQFTTFLSLIETPLRESGFLFTRLDGSMIQKKRVEAISCFQSKKIESPTIMLLSMKAGGVGLNLTAASRVFLMDPAWNPAAEEQCFDRCHRLGQKHEVIITKFIVKNSVEENMIKIQNRKRELAAGAFGTKKPNASERKQARIDEIKTLIDI